MIAAEGVALPQEGQLLPLLLQETPARGSGELEGSSKMGQGEQEPTTQEENAAPFTLHLERPHPAPGRWHHLQVGPRWWRRTLRLRLLLLLAGCCEASALPVVPLATGDVSV